MKRRGQIFLIITILVITFMVGISSVLLQVQRSNYIDTVPDSDNVMIAWENAYQSIIQIMDIELALSSQTAIAGPVARDITVPLNNLNDYLINKGLSAIVQTTSQITYDHTISGSTDYQVSMTGSFYIHLQSGNVEIDQYFTITIVYRALSTTTDVVIITKTVNSQINYLMGAELTVAGSSFIDHQNGKYSSVNALTTGDPISIITKNKVYLDISAI